MWKGRGEREREKERERVFIGGKEAIQFRSILLPIVSSGGHGGRIHKDPVQVKGREENGSIN